MARNPKKPRAAPSPPRGGALAQALRVPSQVVVFRQRHGRTLLAIGLSLVMFKWILPALADMTPPGVDPLLVAAVAEEKSRLATHGCDEACSGMACPAGWTTGRSPDNPCKCICKRLEAGKKTDWDLQRERAAAGAGPLSGGIGRPRPLRSDAVQWHVSRDHFFLLLFLLPPLLHQS